MGSYLPERIRAIVGGLPYEENTTGMSGSRVLMYDDLVLKIGPATEDAAREVALLRFLSGKVPVPRLAACVVEDGVRYLLASRVTGRMVCDPSVLSSPAKAAELLAEGLHMLWAVDIRDCPVDAGLDDQLRQAGDRVAQGLVDMGNAEPDTFGPGGFESPETLLRHLQADRPDEVPVFTHGDYCLPNIFTDGAHVTGLIDLGGGGKADKWADLALCWRSFKHNCTGAYGKTYPGWTPTLLFEALGMAPDWERLRYYLLLDELF